MLVTTHKFQTAMPGLDGLRGVAVLLILVHHFGLMFPNYFVRRASEAGWCGVDLFFALSGFLITGILLDTQGATNYFGGFYARRILRILPLFYAFLLACAALGLPLKPAYWLHLANWIPRPQQSHELLHLWSLSIEEQFYLVWPVLLWRRTPRQVMVLALGVATASIVCRIAVGMSQPYWRYELTPCRLDGFALGGLVAAAVRDEVWLPVAARCWKPIVGLAAAGFLLVVIYDHALEPTNAAMSLVGYSVLALGFSALVAGCAIEDHLAKYPLLTSFGRYSYAIYLLHFPLSVVLEPYYRTRSILVATAWFAGSIAVSWLMGFASWHALEKYPLMLKRFFKPRYDLEPADLGAT